MIAKTHVVYGKVIEPEAGQEFVKTHLDQAMIDTPNYKIVAASRRGRSHERRIIS